MPPFLKSAKSVTVWVILIFHSISIPFLNFHSISLCFLLIILSCIVCLVMSFPAEGVESAIKNSIEDVRLFLDSRHPGHYAVYNLSKRSYRPSRFHNRVRSSADSWNVDELGHPHSYHIPCCCTSCCVYGWLKGVTVPFIRCRSVAGRLGGPPT